jgi:hypothetical protein
MGTVVRSISEGEVVQDIFFVLNPNEWTDSNPKFFDHFYRIKLIFLFSKPQNDCYSAYLYSTILLFFIYNEDEVRQRQKFSKAKLIAMNLWLGLLALLSNLLIAAGNLLAINSS